ncbi:MAG TPA: hypothetical protein DHV44_11700 [Providencia sp.]|uniref:transposase n=2 Tax=Providencia sp. PROV175 TaxID=2949878 RepID=UPI000EC45531|nr:transposase [Providencia sp. PROV175]WOB89802.1 transposase [Providencia sp. PROV175]HCI96926.1 hypothetical protein [Providencia sp.]
MKRKSPKQYTERFKKEAINLILEQGYTVQQAANALGITTKLLYAWRKRHEAENKPNALTPFERQELLALRKEVKQLKMEKEILKKASVDSICQCNTPFNYLFRCFELQCLSRSVV